MKKTFHQKIHQNTISDEEFAKDFTPEQHRMVENELRYYDILMKLKNVRKELGLTQEELAQIAEIPRTTITKIESGSYNPTINTLMVLANAMNKKLEIRFI